MNRSCRWILADESVAFAPMLAVKARLDAEHPDALYEVEGTRPGEDWQ
jgi:hypothetical protein